MRSRYQLKHGDPDVAVSVALAEMEVGRVSGEAQASTATRSVAGCITRLPLAAVSVPMNNPSALSPQPVRVPPVNDGRMDEVVGSVDGVLSGTQVVEDGTVEHGAPSR